MCRSVIRDGKCQDPMCSYAHSLSEVRATDHYFKTAMCSFFRHGSCKLGPACRYAHVTNELRSGTQGDKLLAHIKPGRLQDFSEVNSTRGSDNQDYSDFSRSVTEWSAPVEWEDELGSEHEQFYTTQQDCTQPEAHITPQELKIEMEVMQEAMQAKTCSLSQSMPWSECPSSPPLVGSTREDDFEVRSYEELIQNCSQDVDEDQKAKHWQGQAFKLQQPSRRLSHVGCGYTGVLGNNTVLTFSGRRVLPKPESSQKGSTLRTLAPATPSLLSLVHTNNMSTMEVYDIQGSAVRPSADTVASHDSMQYKIDGPVHGSRLDLDTGAESQQPPSWAPTIPPSAMAPSLPLAMQVLQPQRAVPVDPAQALLREMQARILKAAMPEHYDD